ncbi:uncharacterized protein LOC111806115 [Cucurbita pepo subsp. pepo]|uniref:uncharacterized protein LOC111806115 n=1 Tax=Cucurbita pepo subsp. pepo TaxID=3664 RepID=UPI000C9DA55D|nr:uncharacterized protein LOC111806115 [Cucurbita pepo subsp. pepo]
MNCFSQFSTYTRAIFRATNLAFAASTSIHGCRFNPYWTSSFHSVTLKPTPLDSLCSRFRLRCYSSRKLRKGASPSPNLDSKPPMEPDMGDFFVVRKGDVVGVYKSFTDCQAQIGSSICDLPVSVYKGHSLPKDTGEYLASVGLKNALYTIKAADMRPDLFSSLVPCTFHDEATSLKGEASGQDAIKKRSRETIVSENIGSTVLTPTSKDPLRKHVKLEDSVVSQAPSNHESCFLEFDGASKGNPGQAGAGAVLRAHDGSVICRLREGLGIATNNVAEYRAILLGLKYALEKGFTRIHVQGDSKLVCMQVQGLWKVKNENIAELCNEVMKLKDKFLSFEISHVLRNLNSEADAEANLAVTLPDGEAQEFEE